MLVFSLKYVFSWVLSLLLSYYFWFESNYTSLDLDICLITVMYSTFEYSTVQYSTVQYLTIHYIPLSLLSCGGSRWPLSDRWWRVLRRAFQALLRTLHHLSPPTVILGQMEFESTVILGQMELRQLSYWVNCHWVNCHCTNWHIESTVIEPTVIEPTVVVPTVVASFSILGLLNL